MNPKGVPTFKKIYRLRFEMDSRKNSSQQEKNYEKIHRTIKSNKTILIALLLRRFCHNHSQIFYHEKTYARLRQTRPVWTGLKIVVRRKLLMHNRTKL